ncbi:MAG: ADP-ribosylglycohydrolase family protein [Thermoleophilia bacterium]
MSNPNDIETDIETLYPLLEDYESEPEAAHDVIGRAQGCMLGQLAGDSLGSLVELQSTSSIRTHYPNGIRDLADGGLHRLIAGQPTDDSEMALMLARSIIRAGRFDPSEAAVAYAHWYASPPFDYGAATTQALMPAVAALKRGEDPASVAATARSTAARESQANGALMRVSPLGIYAHTLSPAAAADLARQDAAITHPNRVCRDASATFVVAIAHAVATGAQAEEVYRFVMNWATEEDHTQPDSTTSVHSAIRDCLELAATEPPEDFENQQGWVLIALCNAFWQLLHAPSLEEGVSDTVMRGGDTDTNAAIAGALLGAVHGIDAIPTRWRETILSCRPEPGRPGVHRPRPTSLWPVDALLLARRLVELGRH